VTKTTDTPATRQQQKRKKKAEQTTTGKKTVTHETQMRLAPTRAQNIQNSSSNNVRNLSLHINNFVSFNF
jgi:hypothetical protein